MKRRCYARSKSSSTAQLRLEKIVALQEQVTPCEARDCVSFPDARDRGGCDPDRPNLLMECLRCTVLSLLAIKGQRGCIALGWRALYLSHYEDRNTVGREASRNPASSGSRALPEGRDLCFPEEGGVPRSPLPGDGAGIADHAPKMPPGSGGKPRTARSTVPTGMRSGHPFSPDRHFIPRV